MGACMNKWIAHSLRIEMVAVYLTWAASIGWLLFSERYHVFLRVSFGILLIWALVLLGLFSFAMIRGISRSRNVSRGIASHVRLATLILPLFFILAAQDQPLGSYAVSYTHLRAHET